MQIGKTKTQSWNDFMSLVKLN